MPRLAPVLLALAACSDGGTPPDTATTTSVTAGTSTSDEPGPTSTGEPAETTTNPDPATTTIPSTTTTATTADASTTTTDTTGDPACTGDPIVAPAGTWTWIDFPTTRCGDGSPTGLGVNLVPGSDRLLVYLMGGGGCFTAEECNDPQCNPMFQHCAVNLQGFDAGTMQESLQMFDVGASIFARTPQNPFNNYSWVMIPYCTGDFHAGAQQATYGTWHVGYTNMTAFLERLVPTFCDATDVVLAGSSAGGFGAVFNYDQVRRAFAPRTVDLIDDSGPPLSPDLMPLQATMRAAWGAAATAPADCPACAGDWSAFFPYLAGVAPDARLSLVSSLADFSIGPYFGGPIAQPQDYKNALDAFADVTLAPLANTRVYYVDEFFHVYLAVDLQAKVSQGVALADWLTAQISGDPAWASVRP